jgi:hypothetical protein
MILPFRSKIFNWLSSSSVTRTVNCLNYKVKANKIENFLKIFQKDVYYQSMTEEKNCLQLLCQCFENFELVFENFETSFNVFKD